MNNTTTKAAETAKKAGTTRNTGVRTMVQIAMLAAVATVLMLWEVPMPFIAPSFYKIDLSEVPIMIGAFGTAGGGCDRADQDSSEFCPERNNDRRGRRTW